ncbi:hypothetical protein M408DRAFT_8147 [Serendipita vermifera MAFF 305830]|uniref:3-keto sterol reductase n=1 Tax=Serendipita vermifera MAFF 305830 TaxID=933852 RepID=A0A0C2XK95_SERVB|nr:hypothetical protein M408DRAFT_8147 [Serendipita vermifera MAFF 305830]
MSPPYPIIIVTGANGGVGYGICQRLLLNLSGNAPEDALPQALVTSEKGQTPCEFTPTSRLCLVLACRSLKKAAQARADLLEFFDNYIAIAIKKKPVQSEHLKVFRKNLSIDLLELDLASTRSTFDFCDKVTKTYPYISHAIFNAGCAPWAGINWLLAVKCCLINIRDAVTHPRFKLQTTGVMSDEGLGWTFQCNVFGHFIIYRELQKLLHLSPWPARVIWTASLDVEHTLVEIDWDDWQLIKATSVYETSKYQIELVSSILDLERSAATPPPGNSPIRHLISHPGVTCTNIFTSSLNMITEYLMWMAFILARVLGSPYHPISWINGAIAAAHLALAPLVFLAPRDKATVYGARASFFGNPYVDSSKVVNWPENQPNAQNLVDRCDDLYRKLKQERKSRPLAN